MNPIAKCFLLLGLLPCLIACQGESAVNKPAQETASPAVPSQPAPPAETAAVPTKAAGPTGLAGQVISASDVAGQPDEPLPNQMVLAVPAAKAGEILGAGSEQLTDQELRFLKANLPQANPAIAVTLSDPAGNYTLTLDPGEYILCVADSQKTPPDFPATTRGCGRTQARQGELRRVDISSGFGEILLVER